VMVQEVVAMLQYMSISEIRDEIFNRTQGTYQELFDAALEECDGNTCEAAHYSIVRNEFDRIMAETDNLLVSAEAVVTAHNTTIINWVEVPFEAYFDVMEDAHMQVGIGRAARM
jgi:hypothetical protein